MADELSLRSHAARGPEEFVFTVRSGTALVGTEGFRDAELALLEAADPAPEADVLSVDGNYGVPGVVFGALTPDGRTVVSETSARCATLIERNATANEVDLEVALTPSVAEIEGRFDLAVFAPRAYDPVEVVTQRAFHALAALRDGGELLVAGRPETGAGRVADWLGEEAVVETTTVAGVPVHRVARPASVSVPDLVTDRRLEVSVCGLDRTFLTQPGLFSPTDLDDGSRLLLEALAERGYPADGDRVLDLCCGYGAIGATLGGLADVELILTDDDCRATTCAERTLAANDLASTVRAGDGVDAVAGPFDLVVTNPPTHAGQPVTDSLFAGAAEMLDTAGTLALVYSEPLAYADRLDRWFDEVRIWHRTEGYVVAAARRLPAKGTS